MKFFVERWTSGGWQRVSAPLASATIAYNLIGSLAARENIDRDNFSVVVEVVA